MAKKKKKKPSAATTSAGGGDPLKYFCLVFFILLCVVGFVYFKLKKELTSFERATVNADKQLTGKGLRAARDGDPPAKIHDLALDVEKLVKGHAKAMGGIQSGGNSIPYKKIGEAAMSAGITEQLNAGPEEPEQNPSKGYTLRRRAFSVPPTRLDNLIRCMQNIERDGRYTVFRVDWQLEDKSKNNEAPFNRISKATKIRVGIRQPYTPKKKRRR